MNRPLRHRLLPAMLGLVALSAACSFAGDNAAFAQSADSTAVPARRIPTRLRSDLEEASAATMSRARPGTFWSLNDSGHEPLLFAIDTGGRQLGAWPVNGARNVDWEAMAPGPCGGTGGRHCLYIGDLGDNEAVRFAVTVYRVADRPANAARGAWTAEALTFRYADGAHDVEAMYVMPNGTMHFITKRPLKDSAGRLRPALVFTLPASAWSSRDSTIRAALSDSLPIVPGSGSGRMITDAALAPDGRHLAVRTYAEVYVFAVSPETGKVRSDVAPTVCDVSKLRERQGEAVTWLDATGRLLLMSEGRREPLLVIDCPTPPRKGT